MKKHIRTLSIILAALLLCAILAGCSADVIKTELEENVIISEEGIPDIEVKDSYSELEIQDKLKIQGCFRYFVDNNGEVDIAFFSIDNRDNLDLDEFCSATAEEVCGCMETKYVHGKESRLITYFTGEPSRYLVKAYFFENGSGFSVAEYRYHTEEIRLGDSEYGIWLPCVCDREDFASDTFVCDRPVPFCLDSITLSEWKNTEFGYDDYSEIFEICNGFDNEKLTEEEFNAIKKDGFTLDSYGQLIHSGFGDCYTASAERSSDGISAIVNELTYKSGDQIMVFIETMSGDRFEEMIISGDVPTWAAMGEAMMYTIHRLSE